MTPPPRQIRKMCDPILATLLKLKRRYSQPSRENVTPFSGTSPIIRKYPQGEGTADIL